MLHKISPFDRRSNNNFHYASHDELKQHLHSYLMAYNFAKRLKAIKGKTPWQFILNQSIINPEYFMLNPNHFLRGLNTCSVTAPYG